MHKLLRAGVLITFGMLMICIISGCGDDDPPEEVTDPPQSKDDVPPPPTITVVVDPAPPANPNWIVVTNTEFTLRFSQGVIAVTVNDTPASGSGLNWKWRAHPSLPYGSVTLKIKWKNRDGSTGTILVGPYNVGDNGGEPPLITAGTVFDGEADVGPAPINAGGFRFDFDEPIAGTIKLTDEAGVDLNWIANVLGQTATLTAVAGQELVNETTYKIEIDIQDGVGNRTAVTITFVTKPK